MLQSLKNYYHLVEAVFATTRAGNPAKSMTIIGVTGTDGKTTTSHLIYHLLKETGHKVALISTVAAYIGDKKLDTGFHVSTPDSQALQSYITKAQKAGTTHLVLEVTSHALDQHRVYGIPFKIGVLTNVTRDHLDYHKTMDNYLAAKAKLLRTAEVAIINKDDSSYTFMRKALKDRVVLSYGLDTNSDINPVNHPVKCPMPGIFNLYNTLAALAVCDVLQIDPAKVAGAVTNFKLPEGRVDVVYDKDFKVIIDFAHTPNGLQNILETTRVEAKKNRIIHVFGSAGERDKGKRPLMGEVSGSLADVIIVTSEDPRNELPENIAKEIITGMPNGRANVSVITSRQDAISEAIGIAKKGDFVIITGKGHEKSMNMGSGEELWSDHEAVQKALKLRKE